MPEATFGGSYQTFWHPGDARAAKGVVERIKSGTGIAVETEALVPITCYRCPDCGLLKLYAPPGATSERPFP